MGNRFIISGRISITCGGATSFTTGNPQKFLFDGGSDDEEDIDDKMKKVTPLTKNREFILLHTKVKMYCLVVKYFFVAYQNSIRYIVSYLLHRDVYFEFILFRNNNIPININRANIITATRRDVTGDLAHAQIIYCIFGINIQSPFH